MAHLSRSNRVSTPAFVAAAKAGANAAIKSDSISIISQVEEARWVVVTPDLALKWLDDANTNNRAVREMHVDRLAADMLAGRWKGRNGEAIRFDREGRLVDGQHRLWACNRSGVPIETLLITGLTPDSYSTIDIGKPKSYADFLGPMSGEKNVNNLAAAVRLVYFWKAGSLGMMKTNFPTINQLEQTFEQNQGIRDSVNHVVGIGKKMRDIYPVSFSSLLHYAGTKQGHQAHVEGFLDRLSSGLGLTDTDAVYHLRKFMLGQRGPRPGQRRANLSYVLALGIKAWNATLENKPVRVLSFRVAEDFPKL